MWNYERRGEIVEYNLIRDGDDTPPARPPLFVDGCMFAIKIELP